MHFDTLKEKCEYFRGLTDYRLTPNSYVIAMLDGHCFSKLIKNKYKKPFDKDFMDMMDETAKHILRSIQGAKFAYVQSDEISVLITDFDTPETDSPFGYRLCKLQSILAGMASAKFNLLEVTKEMKGSVSCQAIVDKHRLVEFDCKAWSVPDYNEAFCHFLWRQNDCVRNSKQQAAQTYLPHKELMGLDTDAQIGKLLSEKGIDWNAYTDGEKYGRLIYKENKELTTIDYTGKEVTYNRNLWLSHGASPFAEEGNVIKELIPKRNG